MFGWSTLSDQRGTVAIIVAILLVPVLLGFAALVVDLGYDMVTKNALHNAADAGALAGALELASIYKELPTADLRNYVLSSTESDRIKNESIRVAGANPDAAHKPVSIASGDIRIGKWIASTRTLTVTDTFPDAVEVKAWRVGGASIPTFFARIPESLKGIGTNTVDVRSTSFFRKGGDLEDEEEPTAALPTLCAVPEGEIELPVGISEKWFNDFCDKPIKFYPTTDSCAGWHTFDQSPATANTLADMLQGMLDGTYTSPAVSYEDSLQFIGGNVASALDELKALFDDRKTKDNDGNDAVWTTTVAVYEHDVDCYAGGSNPSGSLKIVGFATVEITNVLAPPEGQLIEGKVKCGVVEDSLPGGNCQAFGTLGSKPRLVQ